MGIKINRQFRLLKLYMRLAVKFYKNINNIGQIIFEISIFLDICIVVF